MILSPDAARREAAVQQMLDATRAFRRDCLLCGGRQFVTGVWCPENSAVVFAPPKKSRAVLYALCRRCHGKPATEKLVERKIIAQLAAKEMVN